MKRSIILFWHGLTGILAGIANWFTVILGMRDESKYGKWLRRIVGTCFASLMLMFLIGVGWEFVSSACYHLKIRFDSNDDGYRRYLSHNVTYYRKYGYVKNENGKKMITGINWIATPLGNDTLICYSDGKARGYFNKNTGEVVIKPLYRHAWIFSEGLASVDDNGWIKFIDQTGKVVIDCKIPYVPDTDGYVFHNGHCVVYNNSHDRVGLMNKQGNWILKPEYFSIELIDSCWIVCNGKEQTVLTANMKTIIPFTDAKFWIYDGKIFATMSDHSMRKYTMKGEVTENFYISNVEPMTYQTAELRYTATKNYNKEGNVVSEIPDNSPDHVLQTARCMCYEAEGDWYGLMSPDGKIITPPSYTRITAIGNDLYLCEENYNQGVILNSKGERVK